MAESSQPKSRIFGSPLMISETTPIALNSLKMGIRLSVAKGGELVKGSNRMIREATDTHHRALLATWAGGAALTSFGAIRGNGNEFIAGLAAMAFAPTSQAFMDEVHDLDRNYELEKAWLEVQEKPKS